MHYINGWCRVVVAINSSMRSMHGHAWTFSEQMIASIIDDSRCEMIGVAFRTAPPIGGLSCISGGDPQSVRLRMDTRVTTTTAIIDNPLTTIIFSYFIYILGNNRIGHTQFTWYSQLGQFDVVVYPSPIYYRIWWSGSWTNLLWGFFYWFELLIC